MKGVATNNAILVDLCFSIEVAITMFILFIIQEMIIFMISCKLVIGKYKGLCNANMGVYCSLGHFWQ